MEEEDAEAELERELAALRSNSEVSITAYLETSPGLGQNLTTSDDDSSSDEEPASFHAFRTALARRDAFCERLQQELHDGSCAPATLEGDTRVAVDSPEQGEDGGSPSTHDPVSSMHLLLGGKDIGSVVATLQSRVVAQRLQPSEPSPAAADHVLGAPANQLADVPVRTIILAADRAAELAREDQRASAQQEQERLHKQGAEVLMQREAEERTLHASRLAALQAAQQAIMARAEREAAAAAAEAAAFARQQEQLSQRLAQQASDLARRRQAAAAAQQELDEQLAAQAWRGFAARHIQRAWRKYAASPAAMLRKHRVTLIQAAWRGRAARKAVGGMRQQQAVLLQLEAAVAKGDMGAVQQVAEQASNMGCGAQVAAQVAAFHAAAHQAAERLATAAATGTALLMSTAVQAAQRFPHLAPAIADASSVFSARRQQAEGALAAAVAGRPVREVVQLAEQAALLGCDPGHLASSLDAARKRDGALAAALLAAAGASPHDPAGFGELVSQAQRLGLEGDVATARLLLDRRRRALLVRLAGLQAKAHGAAGVRPSAVELQALSLEAVALGMEREAEQLSAQLRAQQDALQARLTAAAANSSPAALQALLEEAAEAGLGQEVLSGAQAAMVQRVQAAGQAVQEAASSGTILEYRRARWEALVCGALEPVDRAQHLLQQRRRTVSQQLAAAFSHLASLLQPGGAAATTSQDTAGAAGIPGIPGMPSSLVPGVKGSSSSAGGAAALPNHSQLARQLAMAMAEAAGLAPLLPTSTTSTPQLHDQANPSLPHTPSVGHTSSSPSALPRPVMQPRGSRSLQLKVLCSLAAGSALPPAVAACMAPPARLASGPAPTAPLGPHPPAGSRLLGTGRQQQLGQEAKDAQQQREQAQGREQQQAVDQAWQALVAALRLGLLSGAKLALGALHLQGQVQAAQGVQTVASIRVSSDYWGNLQLNSWQQQEPQGQQEQQGQQQAQDDPMGGDPIACAALKQLHPPPGQDTTGEQGHVELTSSWLWPVQQECQASFQLAASRRKQQPPPGPAPATPPPHPSPRPLLPPTAPYRQQHPPAGLIKPLTQQLLLSITAHSHSQPTQPTPLIHPGPLCPPPSTFTTSTMRPTGTTVCSPAQPPRPHPAAAPAHPPAPAGVPPAPCSPLLAVTQLDLGLERLGSLAGLSLWCPALTSLSAASNQLSSVAGLAGLARLTHLDLKDNRLDCLDGLGPLPSLRRLVLDANSLADWQPAGLGGLPALHHLSVRGNQLTSFQCSAAVRGAADAATAQAAAPATAKPSKAQQDVQNTRADKGVSSSSSSRRGVQAALAPPPALPLLPCAATLTELHAAGNQIISLDGLAPCTALTHLDISHNLVPHLAGLAACVLLRHLNAANNCLTAWPAAELAPMLHLRHLNLNANAITSLLPPAADMHPQHRDISTQPPPSHYPAAAGGGAAGGSSHPFASPSPPGCFRPPHSPPGSSPCLPLPSQLPILLLPPCLAELLLQDNRLSRLPLLQAAPRLSTLDLSFNSLEEPSCLAALAPLTALSSLALNDTPLASHPDYTQAVQAAAPGLQEWDGNPVPAQQRTAALARAVCSNPLLVLWTRQALCSSRGGCDLSHAVVAAAGSRRQAAALNPDPMAPAAAAAAPVGGVPDGPGMAAAGLGIAPLDVWGVPAAPPLPAVIHDPGGAAPPPAAATPRPPPHAGVPLGPPWLEPLLLLAASATRSMAGSGSAGGTLPLASRQQGEPQQWLAGTWCAQLQAAEGEEAAGERLADPQQALHMVGHMAPQLPPGFEPRVLARLAGGMSDHTATGPPAAGGAGWQPGRAGRGAELCPSMTAAVGGVGDRAGVMQGGQGSGAAPCVAAQLAVYVDRPHLLPFKRLALALAGCRLHEQSAPYGDAAAAAAWPAQPGCLSHSSGEAPYVVWQEYGQRHSQAMQQLRQQHCKSAQHLITWEAGQGQQREQGQQGWQEGQAGRVGQEREGQVGPGGQGAGQDQLWPSQLPWGHLSEDSLPGGVEQLVLSDAFALHQQRWLDTAATTIQARWRGYAARCKAQGVRLAQLAALRAAAATKVQAAWRGHRVRSSEAVQSALRQRQAAADASARLQQEAMTAQAQHRAPAATLIQAVFRGHLVRRRLRAAKQAARYVDEDEDEYGGVSEDFLADIENLMADQHLAIAVPPLPASHTTAAMVSSKPTPHPAPSIAPQQQTAPTAVSPPPSHSPPAAIMQQLPALSRAFAAAAANRRLPALPATTTAATGGGLALLPPSGTQPGHHAASPPHPSTSTTAAAGNSSSGGGGGGGGGVGGGWLAPSPPAATSLSGLLLPPLSHPGSYSQDPASHRAQHTAWQQELRPPPVSVGHGHGLGSAAPQPHLGWSGGYGGEEGGEGEEGGTEEPGSPSGASHVPSSISPSAQAEVQAARQQRHREKMEALMAEWGFSDMATAEVYWRRQQRQTQGSQRRKLEARFRDPGSRLKKLQAKVEQRPKLRAEDMQRPAHHGPEVHLSKGSLRGPPSRQQPTSPGAGGGGKDSGPHSTATSPGGPAGAPGPPAAQPRPWNSGPVSQPPAAAAQPGQQGPRSALSADAVAALSAAHGQLVPAAAVVRAWGHEAVAGVAYPPASHAPKAVVSPPPLLRSSSFGSSLGVGLAAGAPTQTVRSSQQQQVGREGGAGLLPELLPTLRRSTALSDSLPPYSSTAARTLAPHSLASAGAAAAHPPPVHLPPTGSGSGQTQARPGASTQGWSAAGPPAAAGAGSGGGAAGLLRAPRSADSLASEPLHTSSSLLGTGWQGGGPPLAAAAAPPAARVLKLGGSAGRAEPRASGGAAASAGARSDASSGPQAVAQPLVLPQVRPVANNWVLSGVRDSSAAHQWLGGQQQGGAGRAGVMELAGVAGAQQMGLSAVPVGRAQKPGGEGAAAQKLSHKSR